MPTFTAVSLDRFLESGAPISIPLSESKLKRTKSTTTTIKEKKSQWARLSPALYTTPEAIPVPDSPSSFPPSPYIVNHKRRGPRVLKSSLSVDNVSLEQKATEEDAEKLIRDNGRKGDSVGEFCVTDNVFELSQEVGTNGFDEGKVGNGGFDDGLGEMKNLSNGDEEKVGNGGLEDGAGEMKNLSNREFSFTLPVCNNEDVGASVFDTGKLLVEIKNLSNLGAPNMETDNEFDDFFDPPESMSVVSNTEAEDSTAAAHSCRQATPVGDYFDAFEELSEPTAQSHIRDVENELRGIRLSLSMEIERRKQAEEALEKVQMRWQRLREQLSLVGLTFTEAPTSVEDDNNLDLDPSEELCRQIHLARVVSNSMGRAFAKAEVEMEMESKVEAKDFEIARLLDRLRYYEAANDEMFQRKQEAIEMERRLQERRKTRQKWVWASIGTAITLGTAALAWSYIPSTERSFTTDSAYTPVSDDSAKP